MTTPSATVRTDTDRIVILGLALWFCGAYAVGARWAPWGDEGRYLEIVRSFGDRFNLGALRSYPAMTTPLTFVVYAAWGHIAGFGTWQLRALSPIIAICTFVMLDDVMRRAQVRPRMRFATLIVLCVNPYVVGLGVFVFTDMIALLMIVMVLRGIQRERAWLVAIGLGGGLLTRQYNAFMVIAVAYVVVDLWLTRDRRRATGLAAAVVTSLLPFAGFVWLWRGLAPDNGLRVELLSGATRFNPHWLSLYLAAPGVYLAPLLLVALRRPTRLAIGCGVAASLVTILFPIMPAAVQVAQCCADTGYADRWLLRALGPLGATTVFAIAAWLWVSAMVDRFAAWAARGRTAHDGHLQLVCWVALAAFLAVMPWSYMPWEKYALPELVVSALAIALGRRD